MQTRLEKKGVVAGARKGKEYKKEEKAGLLRARTTESARSHWRDDSRRTHLLLGLLLLALLALALGADADEAGVGASLAELVVRRGGVLLLGGDLAGLLLLAGAVRDREGGGEAREALRVLGGALGVALLDLAGLFREDDEAGLVGLEALDVELQALLAAVAAAVVDGDAEREGLLGAEAGLLELSLGETAAGTELAVVADRRGTDGRAQELDRAVRAVPSPISITAISDRIHHHRVHPPPPPSPHPPIEACTDR